jgi:NMD protein affecting ribosome stability and mRNA decay
MKYIMKNCQCNLTKEELTEHNAHGYRCPNHPDNGIEFLMKNCIDCDKEMILSPKQSTTTRCPECRDKIKKERNKMGYKRKRSKGREVQINKIDLSLYAQGLDRYLK